MGSIILSNRGDEQKIIQEEKSEWVFQVLLGLGVAEEILIELSNEDIVNYLESIRIEVISNISSDGVDIYREEKIVAQWKKPKLILIKEKRNKYYYEIHLNEWALPFQMKKRKHG